MLSSIATSECNITSDSYLGNSLTLFKVGVIFSQAFTANLTKINRLRAEIDIMKQEYQMAVEDWMES